MSIASTIEQYRKGSSFGDWAERLEYNFKANKYTDDLMKTHFMNLCGSYLYSELKTIYKKSDLDKATYTELVEKLKQKLDKTEPDLVQRFRFSKRIQHPDETAEEFVQAVKLQAEFCNFGEFRDNAILDRVLVGLTDDDLKEQLLKEEKLTIAKMDKYITTWNIAKSNVHAINARTHTPPGNINQIRRPVRERLGFNPYNNRQNSQYRNNYNRTNNYNRQEHFNNQQRAHISPRAHNSQRTVRFQHSNRNFNRNANYNNNNNGYNGGNNNFRYRTDYSRMTCDHCGQLGHIKRKCFRLRNQRREAVNFVTEDRAGPSGRQSAGPSGGSSAETGAERQLSNMMGRLSTGGNVDLDTSDTDCEEWNAGVGWKRGNPRS
ncbi:uncharacterized protein DDB_G0289917-like [Culex pipiens pallens]|uniref:uncharacterized protein DDB_G0289917-like n=1 Tax=Culex pipiens pallens TaxID=42434 RepID=UPI001952B2EC|nr:uncharacterized protein DDB_G0289917-like [Culex pipiens pallens]XP_039431988.1 uncharacterized protein DDB_G0289917-like [Culex pipiens pallens]XP_039431989.1 uncharacterized protein DDB_G0289917-like [Culex pipiens pallens]